jgi:hypothetical protein
VRSLLIMAVALIVVPSATAAFGISMTTASPVIAPGATLNGLDQKQTFTVVTSIANTSSGGSTAGWNETASATIPASGAQQLPALSVTAVTATGGSPNATNSVTWPITLGTTAVKVFNAALNTGLGTMSVTHTLQISYPANALPGTYVSSITFALISGP